MAFGQSPYAGLALTTHREKFEFKIDEIDIQTIRMPVLTRSRKAILRNKNACDEEARKASLKIAALSVPGVVSQIASKLPKKDRAIKGLFTLVNDARYRHELQPFADEYLAIQEKRREEQRLRRRNKRLVQYRYVLKHKLEKNIRQMTDVIQLCEGYHYKFISINALLLYLVEHKDNLDTIGHSFGIVINTKLTEYVERFGEMEMFEERDKILEHRHSLSDYLTWSASTIQAR